MECRSEEFEVTRLQKNLNYYFVLQKGFTTFSRSDIKGAQSISVLEWKQLDVIISSLWLCSCPDVSIFVQISGETWKSFVCIQMPSVAAVLVLLFNFYFNHQGSFLRGSIRLLWKGYWRHRYICRDAKYQISNYVQHIIRSLIPIWPSWGDNLN